MSISKSPHRNTFQKERYLERKAKEGLTPENDETVRAMANYFDSWNSESEQREEDSDWRENNMEYDLRTTDWILEKVRSNEAYAQNLYAAMCNNEFQKNEFLPRLKDETWSCSWRYAGGIIADMRREGDYIDWYCSGIRHSGIDDLPELTEEQKQRMLITDKFVSESVVTEEIETDLKRLGWYVITDSNQLDV